MKIFRNYIYEKDNSIYLAQYILRIVIHMKDKLAWLCLIGRNIRNKNALTT